MNFYEVFVSTPAYHGVEPLTYASDAKLQTGTIVVVPFGTKSVLGIITKLVEQPAFETKQITRVVHEKPLPHTLQLLREWMSVYYPAPSGLSTQVFLPSFLHGKLSVPSKAEIDSVLPDNPPLTEEQVNALEQIRNTDKPVLLHGETGSGKTRIYTELIADSINAGKSALILTPEIGLTPQITETVETQFPGKVVVMHSTLTDAARRKHWTRIHESQEPIIVIGPRSALFAPIHTLGLLIVDEAHDNAYKQESAPRYQTTRVAAHLAELSQARLVLGSATPLVHDYFTFEQKGLAIIQMKREAKMPVTATRIEVVDLTKREGFSKSPWLSDELIKAVQEALAGHAQSLLFLNRRGTARLVICQNCSWQALCPHCDLPLTYHGDTHHLRCHTCGYVTGTPAACPSCHKTDISFKSIGTKTIVTETQRLFPSARIERFDSDNKKQEGLTEQFDAIKAGEIDILVGTQMLTKGLDLPNLSVVGAIAADTSLYFPDYTAEEQTFQMLRQVIGRVGRGHIQGQAIIQSYHPDSTTISAAVAKDYATFYQAQLKERQLYTFPPYCFLLKVSVERAQKDSAMHSMQKLAANIAGAGLAVEVTGPAPAFIEKIRGKYRWQLVIKAKRRTQLIEVIRMLPKQYQYDIDPANLL